MTTFTVDQLSAILRSNPDVSIPDVAPAQPKRQNVSRETLPAPKEEQEQEWVIQWADAMVELNERPLLRMLYHTPNGGLRDKATAMAMKRAGVKAGIPDLFLPVARGGHHGLWIELKRADHSNHASPDQEWWIEQLTAQGYRAVVCYGANEAIGELEDYLDEGLQEKK